MSLSLSTKITLVILCAAWVMLPAMSQAQLPTSLSGGIGAVASSVAAPGSGLYTGSLVSVFERLILWLLSFVALLALLALIWGGISYIISFGDEKKAEHAKHVIFFAIIGLMVAGLSFAIIKIIESFFK